MLNKKEIAKIFDTFAEHNPSPKIELEYNNTFTLLIAVLLSAQTTDKAVNSVTRHIFDKYNSPEAILLFGLANFEDAIKKIGLYRSKSKNVMKLCQILIEKHNSQVPNKYEDLIKLPGVGRKTADVVLNTAFGKATIAVDRHIFRIVHRIGIVNGKNPDEVSDKLLKTTPVKYRKNAHHWLVLHGRYICTARKPKCHECIIARFCEYNNPIK